MRRTINAGFCILLVLLAGATVQAELLLVENFTGRTEAVTIDALAGNGVLGGTWDTEGENSGNITTRMNDGSMTLRVTSHSTGTLIRGAGIAGLSNTIGNTETGVLFVRFKVASGTRPLQDYLGMHTYTASSFLTGTTCRASSVNAGFGLSCAASSATFTIVTTDNATVLMAGLARNQWYNVWIVADNATDTFDLYVNAAAAPGGDAELPQESDKIGAALPFGTATTSPLAGMLYAKALLTPAAQTEDVFIDDIYWDGDEGLVLTTKKARNPVPVHRATEVALDQVLSWDAPNDPNVVQVFGYDVYADANQVDVTNGAARVRVSTGQTETFFNAAGILHLDTQYYWRVDAKVKLNDPNQTELTVPGSVWTFTCKSSAPVITQQPARAIVAAGAAAAFTVAADSVTPLSYQWYKSSDAANDTPADDVLMSGATAATLTLTSVSAADEGFYYCQVKNATVVISNAAALGVKRTMAHWTLDGLVNGQYEDSSGQGHHADPNGTPVFVSGANPALTGSGVVVDASNGWAAAGTWNPSQYSGQLTFSVWAKWAGQPATPVFQGLVGKRNTWLVTDMMWQLEIANNAASLVAFKNVSTTVNSPILPLNEWELVTVTVSGTTATVYRNGVAAASGNFTFNTGTGATLMLGAVGQDPALTVPTAPFNGVLDDIRIYNYAMSAVEAAYLYTDTSGESVCMAANNATLQAYDFDKNCKVDIGDLVELARHWLYDQLVP